jgi:hypothetical protein
VSLDSRRRSADGGGKSVTGDANEHVDMVQAKQAGKEGSAKRRRLSPAELLFGYLVVVITGLIVLRAAIDSLGFIGIGWLIALALIPLLPWALPRLGGFLQTMSRYVSRVGIGSVQIDLREVTDAAIAVPTSGAGMLSSVPNDWAALSTGTGITEVISALRALRVQGGAPCAIIDLQTGTKWKLPNLYYLSVMLEIDPIVATLFFTEMRRGIDGYLVRMCRAGEFRRQIEQAIPAYSQARGAVELPDSGNLGNDATAQQVGEAFQEFQNELQKKPGNAADDSVFGFVSADRLKQLVVSPAGAVVESAGDALRGEPLRTVLTAADRYVPMTTAQRLSGLIDRDAVVLAVARAALAPGSTR